MTVPRSPSGSRGCGHTSYVYPVAYSPDGRRIASGGWDNAVRLWDAATGEECATLPHPGIVTALGRRPTRQVTPRPLSGRRPARRSTMIP